MIKGSDTDLAYVKYSYIIYPASSCMIFLKLRFLFRALAGVLVLALDKAEPVLVGGAGGSFV